MCKHTHSLASCSNSFALNQRLDFEATVRSKTACSWAMALKRSHVPSFIERWFKLRPGGHTWRDELFNPAHSLHNHFCKNQMRKVAGW